MEYAIRLKGLTKSFQKEKEISEEQNQKVFQNEIKS